MQDYSKSLIQNYVCSRFSFSFIGIQIHIGAFFLSFLSIPVPASLSVKKLSKMHKYATVQY